MPKTDQRTKANTKAGKMQTAGRMNVTYFMPGGRSRNATVLGQGTSSGLKLRVPNGSGATIVDNVALNTSLGAPTAGTYDHRGV